MRVNSCFFEGCGIRIRMAVMVSSLAFPTFTEEKTLAGMEKMNANIQVPLQHIGYDGSWDQFCDAREIDEDFTQNPGHELRKLRGMLCQLKSKNQLDRSSIPIFAVYKYCLMIRPRVDELLMALLAKFSQDDQKLRQKILSSNTPVDNTTSCYRETASELSKNCIGQENPYHNMFTRILARTCVVRWLSTEDITSYIRKVCAGKWIKGEIDWRLIIASIGFKG